MSTAPASGERDAPTSDAPSGTPSTAGSQPPYSDELLGLLAYRIRLIGEPTRMRILLLLLHEGEATVQQIADELRITHQSTSKHLTVLHHEGVLARTRAGSHAHYSIADYTALRVIEVTRASITGHIEELIHAASFDA